MTLYPWGYGTEYRTIDTIRADLLRHYHPEYVRRLCAWLVHKGDTIGVGGTFRADGTQPDLPGFAPEGRSFHQNQQYSDGFIGACAVDLVAANPGPGTIHKGVTWAQVPAQGSTEARLWGLHCNVGTPGVLGSEPWHMQPIEIDGHVTWISQGSPAPVRGYPLPGDHPIPPIGDDMLFIAKNVATGAIHITNGVQRRYEANPANLERFITACVTAGQPMTDLGTGRPIKAVKDVTGVTGPEIAATGVVAPGG